jgi:hypothetical protein
MYVEKSAQCEKKKTGINGQKDMRIKDRLKV